MSALLYLNTFAAKYVSHTSPESDGEAESIQWNLTEELLMAAKSDVLEIFDW